MGGNNFFQNTPFMSNDSFMFNFTPFAWTVPQATPLRWLGGTFPKPPKPTPEPELMFFLDFEGTYTDTIQGLSPIDEIGTHTLDSVIYYEGTSSLYETPSYESVYDDWVYSFIAWYPISGIDLNGAFSIKFYVRGNTLNDLPGYDAWGQVSIMYQLIFNFKSSNVLTINFTYGLLPETLVTTTWTEDAWTKCEVVYENETYTVKINDVTVLDKAAISALDDWGPDLSIEMRTACSKNAAAYPNFWFDSFSITNN